MEKINSVNDAFFFLLKGLYSAEVGTKEILPAISKGVQNRLLAIHLEKHLKYLNKRITSIEGIFISLNTPPEERKNTSMQLIINNTVDQLNDMHTNTSVDEIIIKNMLLLSDYKIGDYSSCHHFSINLKVTFAEELLRNFIDEEIQSGRHLTALYDLLMVTPQAAVVI